MFKIVILFGSISYLEACQTLGVSQLDSVIIAPPGPVEGDSQTLANLQPAWEELTALVRNQQIAAIGTSDLDKDLLEQLYNWADVSVEPKREAATRDKGRSPPQNRRLQWSLFSWKGPRLICPAIVQICMCVNILLNS